GSVPCFSSPQRSSRSRNRTIQAKSSSKLTSPRSRAKNLSAKTDSRLLWPSIGSPAACSRDRKSTRLNSSHLGISYAVFCLKKKNKKQITKNSTYNPNYNSPSHPFYTHTHLISFALYTTILCVLYTHCLKLSTSYCSLTVDV